MSVTVHRQAIASQFANYVWRTEHFVPERWRLFSPSPCHPTNATKIQVYFHASLKHSNNSSIFRNSKIVQWLVQQIHKAISRTHKQIQLHGELLDFEYPKWLLQFIQVAPNAVIQCRQFFRGMWQVIYNSNYIHFTQRYIRTSEFTDLVRQ